MSQTVVVRTGARLHFGLWGINAPAGRQFGGVGMMVSEPGFEIVARVAPSDRVRAATPEVATRVEQFVTRLRQLCPELPPLLLEIDEEITSHQGLGSGTQLALAVAAATLRLAGEPFRPAEWAHPLGRGERSSIGVHGFESGGFLIEAGQLPGDRIGELIGRTKVSDDWRFVLLAPPATVGLSGFAERSAFQQLPPMSDDTTSSLQRIAVEVWLPAMIAGDFPKASAAMWEYGQQAGDYFRAVQGGVFASPRMAELAVQLRGAGMTGIAQTSWGPTLAVLCRDEDRAHELRDRLLADAAWQDLSVQITPPLNVGATIFTVGGETQG
jgi:beta-ribofuranosylaminobenzene 5'-phosphate synthase